MNIYLDTANVKDIKEAVSQGSVDGITTNPSLAAKEGRNFKELLLEICNLVDGPISAEVISVEADAIVKEGRELAKLHKNIIVKCPLIPEGLKATKRLAGEGIRVIVFFTDASVAGGESGRLVRLSVYRAAGRHQSRWNGVDPSNHHDLQELR